MRVYIVSTTLRTFAWSWDWRKVAFTQPAIVILNTTFPSLKYIYSRRKLRKGGEWATGRAISVVEGRRGRVDGDGAAVDVPLNHSQKTSRRINVAELTKTQIKYKD